MNYGTLLLIIGVIVLIPTILIAVFGKKKEKRMTFGKISIVALFAVAIGVISIFATIPGLDQNIDFSAGEGDNTLSIAGTGDATQPSSSTDTLPTGECAVDGFVKVDGVCQCIGVEDTTVALAGENIYTTLATGGTHRYSLDGAPDKTISDGGSFTASPGNILEVLYMNGSETDSEYFSLKKEYIIPCKGTVTFSEELYSNGTVSIEVFNEEKNLIDLAGNNETLAAGEDVELDMNIKTSSDKAYPYGGVMVGEFGIPVLDDVEIDFGGVSTSTPNYYHVTNGSQTTRAYTVPAFYDGKRLPGTLKIKTDDSRDPTGVLTDVLNLTFFPNDLFINQDAGGSFDGPAVIDEDNTQTKKYSLQYAVAFD